DLLHENVFRNFFFFSSRRRHTRSKRDWSSDVCSSDLFAKDTTEFETLAELRADVKAKLEEQAKNAADAEMRNALVEKVSANTERSEERRVGKECRCQWGTEYRKKKKEA